VNRALTVAPGARRRGSREGYCVTRANYLWRIQAAATGLRHLLDLEARGARTLQAVNDLSEIERRVERMLNEAQLDAIEQELRPREERTACDG
jgi:hypothetical protein